MSSKTFAEFVTDIIAVPHTEADKILVLDVLGVPVEIENLSVSIDDERVVLEVNKDGK